jgi:NADH:ubiquinone oxidoreductase subunit 4 (subunit M)
MLNMLAMVILKVESAVLLGTLIPMYFLLLMVGTGTRHGMHRLLLVFGTVATVLLSWSLLAEGEQRLGIELLGLVFFIGLFPLSPWYSRLFETLPSGLLASSFVFQIMLVMSLEQQQALSRDPFMLILPALAIVSLLIALAQSSARRALSGLATSQLAFLVYADSGQHFSELAALLLAQAQAIAVTGLILTVGTLETRVGELNISRPSGQYDSYPKLASAMLLFGLMGAGFPLTLAYIAEDLVLESGFRETPWFGLTWLLVTALTAITVIKLYLYLCHGRKGFEPGIDILPSKLIAAVLATSLLVFSSFSLAG